MPRLLARLRVFSSIAIRFCKNRRNLPFLLVIRLTATESYMSVPNISRRKKYFYCKTKGKSFPCKNNAVPNISRRKKYYYCKKKQCRYLIYRRKKYYCYLIYREEKKLLQKTRGKTLAKTIPYNFKNMSTGV